ncbi:SdrD B-like domain-containing protein [Roseateles sp.]|uniref:SdrD B-like domain-containing protein n=1 Tax=Roseateles sp. TaxID=1971397 RepID=UPI0039E820D4
MFSRILAILALAAAGGAQAQLQITGMPDSPDPVPAGGTVTYQIGVADAGGSPQSGVTLNVDIPANGRYAGMGSLPGGVSCGGMAVGQAGPGTVTCTGINIPAMGVVQVPVRVTSTAAGTMTVSATPVGGATQSETTTVNVGADLSIAINTPATAAAGSTLNIQLTVANAGPYASPASTLHYSVPPGLVLGTLPGGCSVAGSTVSCSIGNLGIGASSSVTLNGIIGVGGGSTLTHTADVAAGGGVGDGDTSNNTTSVNTSVTPGSSLAVTKTKSVADPVQTGQGFNFQFAVRYSGDAPSNLQLSDPLPANFCPVSATFSSGGWSCTASSTCPAAGGTLTCTRPSPAGAGANASLGSITAAVQALTSGPGIINTATVGATGVTPAQGSVNTTVIDPSSDLRANKAKSWPQAAVPVNQPFNYTISTTNLGPSAIPSSGTITLTDTVPANLQINSITQPAGFTCISSAGAVFPQTGPLTITCNSSNVALAVNATTSNVTLNAQVTVAGGSVTNTMCVSGSNVPADPDNANNCASVGVNPQAGGNQADVSVLKRVVGVGDSPGNRQLAGQPIVWEIEVVNAGPQPATGVVVTDTLNDVFNANASQYGVSVVAGAATMGACTLTTTGSGVSLSGSNCTIATLPICTAGADCPRIQLTVRPHGDGTAANDDFTSTNSAFALSQAEADPNLANNTSATATAYLTARTDVAVAKADNPDPAAVGQLLTYTITASNPAATSASQAYNVMVTDTLPAGLVLVSAATASGGGSCPTQPAVGSTTGPGNNSIVCSWASLARGSQQTVTVQVRAIAALAAALGGPGSVTNSVVISTTTPEVAGGAANNTASEATALSSPTYDLIVNNTDDIDPANVGDAVVYLLTVTNNAASTAENVRLTDTLSNAVGAPTFDAIVGPLPVGVSCDTSGVTVGQAGGSLSCTIPVLGGTGAAATGEPNSVQIRVRLIGASKGTYTNTASVRFVNAALDAFDNPQANNTAAEPTTFRNKADVEVISKTAVQAGTATPVSAVGQAQAFDWLVELRNNGPQSADNDSFTDTLPANLQLAGAPVFTVTSGLFTPAAPTCTGVAGGTVVSCAVSSMPSGATATVRIPVQVVGMPAANSVLTNTAHFVTNGSGDTNGGTDPNGGNNHSSGSVTVMSLSVSGRVYEDLNGNGQPDAGEPGIAGVQIAISGPVNQTTTTDVNGNWSFTVPAGSYTVVETQPAGYQPGITRAGSVTGAGSTAGTVPTSGAGVLSGPNGSTANTIQAIVLAGGGFSINNNFGEVRAASLAGRVYLDADRNGVYSANEEPIGGVAVKLTGTDDLGNTVSLSTTTAAAGGYVFDNLRPGIYGVAETQPESFADGAETVGSAGGNASINDVISGVVLGSGAAATGYNFGEFVTRITVHVFEDPNNDGLPALTDAGIPGVTLTLTGRAFNGTPVSLLAQPTAGGAGYYEFSQVLPSDAAGYTITETQPANYAPGKAHANGQPGEAQPSGNVISGIVVPAVNPPAWLGDYLFGELLGSRIQGRSFYDRDGDGQQGAVAREPGIPGVTITLTGTDGNGNPVNRTMTTDANGDYVFANVAEGRYTLTETRPAGYLPGLTHAGSVTGTGSTPGTVPTSGSGVTTGPLGSDAPVIQNIVLGSAGAGSAQNNFASVRPSALSGHVYIDTAPANGQLDAGEALVPGVNVMLSGTDLYGRNVSLTQATDANGAFAWNGLLPGRYQLDETQPAGMADGAEHLGTVDGVARGTANPGGTNDRFGDIQLASEEQGVDYDFGERGGQIAGQVYVDRNDNGQRDAGEAPIPGVTLTLTGRTASGQAVNLTVTTDAQGRYSFDGLLPSDAAGYAITETQPKSYADGRDAVGRIGGQTVGQADGSDRTGHIVFPGGVGEGYDFGERGASLTGHVINDVDGNTKKDRGDLPLPGVVITLSGMDADGHPVTRVTTTDGQGRYRFDDLPMSGGTGYTLTQQPVPDSTHVGEVPGSLGGSVPAPRQILVALTTTEGGVEYDFFERLNKPSSLTGSVWWDTDHDRQFGASEKPQGGWTVELVACPDGSTGCPPAQGAVIDNRTTGGDGGYRFDNLTPGNYQLRFRDPQGQLVGGEWPTDPVLNGVGGPFPTVSGMPPRISIPVTITAGQDVIRQDLPLDPGGVVFDSVTAEPVAGAQVSIAGPAGFDPAKHLLNGQGTVTTAADGRYQFFLLPGAPAGSYQVGITPPAGYMPSATYPPAKAPLDVVSCSATGVSGPKKGGEACVVSKPAEPVSGQVDPYFMTWLTGGAVSRQVVNNHIPLDKLAAAGSIELRKSTTKLNVRKGEPVPYVITARNAGSVAIGNVTLQDTLPPGFKYLEGSLTVQTLPGGPVVAAQPSIQGRVLTLSLNFAAGESKRISMVLGVGLGVGEGQYVNSVVAQQGAQGREVSNTATAAVRVVPDAMLDCTDLIGKVWDDRNANGLQDQGEPGLAGVRVATVNGQLVTTDTRGRYHIACAAVPKDGTGSNFVLKLDERTLPSGYRVTTENPAAGRATRGKVLKIDFGATVHRVVRLELRSDAFEPGGNALRPQHQDVLTRALAVLPERPSVLRLSYRPATGESVTLGESRVAAIKSEVLKRWAELGRSRELALFDLDVEIEMQTAVVNK